jgi:membrane fusion protein (multidrug efflux system)
MVLLALLGGAIVVAWGGWFVLARVGLYETSQTARLEVEESPYDLDAPVTGRLLRTHLALDQKVEAGEILIEFDSAELRAEKVAEESRLAAISPQIEALERELASENEAMRNEGIAVSSSLDEAKARQRAMNAIAELKEAESRQVTALRKAQIMAEVDRQRSQADAEQKFAEAEAASAQVDRLGKEGRTKRSDRRARAARLEADIAALVSERVQCQGRIGVLEERIALHLVRAPVRGHIAHFLPLQPGSVVAAGTRLCTVIPGGRLRVVAFFQVATAGGRLVSGQPARIRLFAFPWTKYGVLEAWVERVGQEPRNGLIRVEMRLSSQQKTSIPIQHGLTGSAEVEVERVSPIALVLDAAGRYMLAPTAPIDPEAVSTTTP